MARPCYIKFRQNAGEQPFGTEQQCTSEQHPLFHKYIIQNPLHKLQTSFDAHKIRPALCSAIPLQLSTDCRETRGHGRQAGVDLLRDSACYLTILMP